MDILASVLRTAAVTGTVAATVNAGDTWGLRLAEVPGAAFHAVTSGTAHLLVEGHDPVRLLPGDVVLLPTGAPHDLLASPGCLAEPFDHLAADAALEQGGTLTLGPPPLSTQVVCASYGQDSATRWSPFDALPPVVYVPALSAPPGLRTSLTLITDELAAGSPGIRHVLDRVVDIVLVQVLRAWIEGGPHGDHDASWLRGLGDPTTSRALAELHRDPAFPWTVSTLARQSGVSRATLARRFESEVGTSPGTYLSSWRMELAARRLRTGDDTVGAIARTVGYRSEYAFNRAFARHYGLSPGRYRTGARTSSSADR